MGAADEKSGAPSSTIRANAGQEAVSGPITAFVVGRDGVRLHARIHGPAGTRRRPVICLPGLARTAADFERLATVLARDPGRPRRVIALDYRGRGLSDYDDDPANYNLAVELADVLAVATALDALPAVFVGTSRGGLITMLLAATRPDAIAGAVLNDIGPVIEPAGLARIRGYVGKLPQPASYEHGAEILRELFAPQFPRLGPADWLAASHRTFKRDGGRLVPTYDVRLARTLQSDRPDDPLPTLWPQFDALGAIPLMLIRGANSDLLSPQTVAAMRTRRPDMTFVEVPDQGHAPLLAEPEVLAAIADFVALRDPP